RLDWSRRRQIRGRRSKAFRGGVMKSLAPCLSHANNSAGSLACVTTRSGPAPSASFTERNSLGSGSRRATPKTRQTRSGTLRSIRRAADSTSLRASRLTLMPESGLLESSPHNSRPKPVDGSGSSTKILASLMVWAPGVVSQAANHQIVGRDRLFTLCVGYASVLDLSKLYRRDQNPLVPPIRFGLCLTAARIISKKRMNDKQEI